MASSNSLTAGELAVKLTLDSTAFYRDLKAVEKSIDQIQKKYDSLKQSMSTTPAQGTGGGTGSVAAAIKNVGNTQDVSAGIQSVIAKLTELNDTLSAFAKQQATSGDAVNKLLTAYQNQAAAAAAATAKTNAATAATTAGTAATKAGTAATTANAAATSKAGSQASQAGSRQAAAAQASAASAVNLLLKQADLAQSNGRWAESIRKTEEALRQVQAMQKSQEWALVIEKKLVDRQADAEIQLAQAKGKRKQADSDLTTQSTRRLTVENSLLNAEVLRTSEERKKASSIANGAAQLQKYVELETKLKGVLASSTAGVRARKAAQDELNAIQKAKADQPRLAADAALEQARASALKLARDSKDVKRAIALLNSALSDPNATQATKARFRETSQLMNALKRELAGVSATAKGTGANISDMAARQALSGSKIAETQMRYIDALELVSQALDDANVSQSVRNKLLERQAYLIEKAPRASALGYAEGGQPSLRRLETDLQAQINMVSADVSGSSAANRVKVLQESYARLKAQLDSTKDSMKELAATSTVVARAEKLVTDLNRQQAEARLKAQVNNLKSADSWGKVRTEIAKTKALIATLKATAGPDAISRALGEVQRASGRTSIAMSALRGVIGGVFGGFTAYSIVQTAVRVFTQFTLEAVKSANALEVNSYSLKIVARDTKTYLDVLKLARDNQRLFGGSLQDNVANLTGFTLIARTAGVDLKSLVSVAQRLSLFDPVQGLSGASTALREFLAGNIRSLRERFELPSQVLDTLSDVSLTVQERLSTLSTFLDNQGLSMEDLSGKMGLTAQAYQNFGIAWETTTTRMGTALANFFAPATQGMADFIDRINNDADQLARDYYRLGSNIILTSEQYQKGVELAAEGTIEAIERMRLGMQRPLTVTAPVQQGLLVGPLPDYLNPDLDNFEIVQAEQIDIIDGVKAKAFELLKVSTDLAPPIMALFEAFSRTQGTSEDLQILTDGVEKLYEELIGLPSAIAEAKANLDVAFVANPGLIRFQKIIEEIIRNQPELAMVTWDVVDAFQNGDKTSAEFAARLNRLLEESRAAADAAAGIDGEYKSLNMQFVEAKIKANDVERSQRLLTVAMDQAANSAFLSAEQTAKLADMLGIEERKVENVISKWRELNNVRILGTGAADEIARIERLSVPGYVKESAIDKVFEGLYGDFDFEQTATDVERLAKAEDNYQKVVARYASDTSPAARALVFEAYKERELARSRITKNTGSSMTDTTASYTESMADIITDYQDEMIDAEKDYQQKILDIQKEFQRKQAIALQRSETGKRRATVSTYRALIDSELTQPQQQELSATYEADVALAMTMAAEGRLTQSQDLIDLASDAVQTDIDMLQSINDAVESGDLAKAEALRYLHQLEKNAREIDRRTIVEGGDANVEDFNAATKEAEDDQIVRVDAINTKFSDRAKTLLENEPKITEALNGTNLELSNQAKFLQDLAGYTSPVSQGLDGIATSADTALDGVMKFVDYLRNNNLGLMFTGGMTAGIQAGTGGVVDAAAEVVDAALDSGKDELQARSPSRRTHRELGIPFVQGMMQGIEASAKSLDKTISAVISRSVETAKSKFADLPAGIRKTQANIDAFKDFAETNINILEGLRGLLPDKGGSAQGRAQYIAAVAKIDQDTEAQITARRQKLAQDVLLARTDDERRILEAIAQQDIALLQQQANIQKSSQDEEMRNVADQEAIDSRMSEIQQNAANQLKALQERMKELAKTNPEEAARRYQLRAQAILERANLTQELERYLMENNLTADDAFAALLRQQIQQASALANMEIFGTGVGNAAINSTVYNINMDLTGSNLRKEDVERIVRREIDKALSTSKGSTA